MGNPKAKAGWDFDLDKDTSVTCACGSNNCHPTLVRVNQGGKVTHVTRDRVGSELGPPSGRGTSIAIEFYCEDCPRIFLVVYQFHKGTTYTGRVPGAERKEEAPPREMWRD